MPVLERSAGFVVYHVRPGDRPAAGRAAYLLLDYGRQWDFAKGHVEKGEDDLAAATRELAEETGIRGVRVVPGFRHEITYFFRHKSKGLIRKTVVFFLDEAGSEAVTLSHEHVGYAFLPAEPAGRRVTFANAKQVLRLAHEHLQAHPAVAGLPRPPLLPSHGTMFARPAEPASVEQVHTSGVHPAEQFQDF